MSIKPTTKARAKCPTEVLPPQDKFRLLFEHSSDPHFIFDANGIADCNDATLRILNSTSKEQVLALHPSALSPERQPDGMLSSEKAKQMDALARERGVYRFDWVHRKLTGEEFPVQVTLNYVPIEGGREMMIAVWHDLTERKKNEENLRQMADELREANLELIAAHDKMRADVEAAAIIQKSLLPNSSPLIKGLKTAWSFEPSSHLGGDILNYFALDERRVGFYVLDVTGHGIAASLLSVAVSHALSPFSQASFLRHALSKRSTRDPIATPSEVARKLNDHFGAQQGNTQFFSFAYGILNLELLEFSYVTCGHPPPLLLTNQSMMTLLGTGFPIGVMNDVSFESRKTQLKAGDRLYLYSDGVIEARAAQGEFFGEERFAELIRSNREQTLHESVENVVRSVREWCGSDGPPDDVSLLAFEITPA